MSKGSHRRKQEVDEETMEVNWNIIFKKPECPECGSKRVIEHNDNNTLWCKNCETLFLKHIH